MAILGFTAFEGKAKVGDGVRGIRWSAATGELVVEGVRSPSEVSDVVDLLAGSGPLASLGGSGLATTLAEGTGKHGPDSAGAPIGEVIAEIGVGLPATEAGAGKYVERALVAGREEAGDGASRDEAAPAPPASPPAPPVGPPEDMSVFGRLTQLKQVVEELKRRGAASFADVEARVAELKDTGGCPMLLSVRDLPTRLRTCCVSLGIPGAV